jgi:AcrR family transcriptional regulator
MPRPKSDIEPRIVHAARERFLVEGVEGSSLRSIAKLAKTSIGMIYYYFPTKDDLFLAVVEEVYTGFLEDLAHALTPDAPIEERLRRVSERIGNASDLERDVIKLVLREALVSSSRLDRLLDRFRRGHLALVLGALADGVAEGDIHAEHPPAVLLMSTFTLTVIPQLVRRFVGDKPPFSGAPEGTQLAAELVGILFHGIAAPPSTPPRDPTKEL